MPEILDAAKVAEGRVAWLGYGRRQGPPKIGAHFVSFNRAALAAFKRYAREILRGGPLAFDTLLHRFWKMGRARAPFTSMAHPVRHASRGRR